MNPLGFIRSLTPFGKLLLLGALAIALVWGFVFVRDLMVGSAKVEAKLGRNQTEAALQSGTDAVGTIGAQGAAEEVTDRITRENDNAIRSAPGADTPVPAAVDSVARERLCRRAVYRERPECLQFPAAD